MTTSTKIFATIVSIIVLVGGISYAFLGTGDVENETVNQLKNGTYTPEPVPVASPESLLIGKRYKLDKTPNGINLLLDSDVISVKKDTIDDLAANDEIIQGHTYYAPVTPKNSNKVFLSAALFDKNTKKIIKNSIYGYHVETGELTQMYWQNERMNSNSFKLLGADDKRVYLLYNDAKEQQTDECFSPWLSEKVYFVDLENYQTGLQEFTLPVDFEKEEELKQRTCS